MAETRGVPLEVSTNIPAVQNSEASHWLATGCISKPQCQFAQCQQASMTFSACALLSAQSTVSVYMRLNTRVLSWPPSHVIELQLRRLQSQAICEGMCVTPFNARRPCASCGGATGSGRARWFCPARGGRSMTQAGGKRAVQKIYRVRTAGRVLWSSRLGLGQMQFSSPR